MYHDQKVSICSSESRYTDALRKSFLRLELRVQALAEIGLNTHRLHDEDAHPDHALLGSVGFVHNSIEYTEDDKVVRAVRIDDK